MFRVYSLKTIFIIDSSFADSYLQAAGLVVVDRGGECLPKVVLHLSVSVSPAL